MLKTVATCDGCLGKGNRIFSDLDPSDLSAIKEHKVNSLFKKGQTLFVEGGPTFGLYCIGQGNIKLTKNSVSGREFIVRLARKGDMLGLRCLFTSEKYTVTATALDDSSVCFIDREYIVELVRRKPTVACNIISRLAYNLGESEAKLAGYALNNIYERTSELLLGLSKGHGQVIENGYTLIKVALTREEMASMIGTATETLIRVISYLKKENVLAQHGRNIVILNIDKLASLAN